MTDVTGPTEAVLDRLERSYDAIPRVGEADVEAVGPFELFLQRGAGWPYYARPRVGASTFTEADVAAILARQEALGVPRAIEWVHEVTPSLLPAVGDLLPVTLAPLMVLDPSGLPDPQPGAVLLDPDAPDFADQWALSRAVAGIGFGHGGTAIGAPGPAERDAATSPVEADLLAMLAAGLRAGHKAEAIALDGAQGIVARGGLQSALGAAEVVGVATLPSARHQGHGAAVSALLARTALARGNDLVFLSAASQDVARVYGRIGFRRVGTAAIAEGAH